MDLGLKQDEVRLSGFSPEWSREFDRVKKEILKNTSLENCRIEHIGSTAIINMEAKPVIDILIGLDNLEEELTPMLINGLKESGFLRLKVQRPNEVIFAKFADTAFEIKTHFIHLVEYDRDLWHNFLFFRDYLNGNEQAKKQYVAIKQRYLAKSTTGINDYTDFKESFVKEIVKLRNN